MKGVLWKVNPLKFEIWEREDKVLYLLHCFPVAVIALSERKTAFVDLIISEEIVPSFPLFLCRLAIKLITSPWMTFPLNVHALMFKKENYVKW